MESDLVPFVEKIERMALPVIKEIGTRNYSSKDLTLIKPPIAKELTVYSLDSVIEYMKTGEAGEDAIISVEEINSVRVYKTLNSERDRECLVHAEMWNSNLRLGQFIPAEDFNIMIQSQFAAGGDKGKVLSITRVAADSTVREQNDDGVQQEVAIKSGIINKGWENVPNPVTLLPFRTFPEITPPQIRYILRAKKSENGIMYALFDAEGEIMNYNTINRIKIYLREHIEKVTVI